MTETANLDAKVYPRSRKMAFTVHLTITLIFDALIAILIVEILGFEWEYAYFKVFIFWVAISLVREMLNSASESIAYHFTIKDDLRSEIIHYVDLYRDHVNWYDVHNYDEFLIHAASSDKLPNQEKLFLAVEYGVYKQSMRENSSLENRLWKLFDPYARKILHEEHNKLNNYKCKV